LPVRTFFVQHETVVGRYRDDVRVAADQAAVEDRPGAGSLTVRHGEVEFRSVNFAYDPRRSILHQVSFSIPPGCTVAVVGASGAGKSTIVRVVLFIECRRAG
jgi:ABC-type transport system involved in Fe-S cluster assembly fused permease/ATPase subunit